MGSPTVSVVLPTYERPDMLRQAVESVRAQTYDDIELLVVDDASATPADSIIEEQSRPFTIRVIRHETNRGANAARNTGISEARGEILTFLDDDDRWAPRKLAVQVNAFHNGSPDLGVVLVGQRYVNDQDTPTGVKYPEISGQATAALFSGMIAGPFSTMAVDREVVEAAGMPDERFPSLQDREWLIRLSRHCTFESIAEPLVIRRMGAYAQIGDRFVERRDRTYRLMLENYVDEAATYGRESEFRAYLARGVAASALEAGAYGDARRFALLALRAQPTSFDGYLYGLLSLGGPLTYSPARHLKRQYRRVIEG